MPDYEKLFYTMLTTTERIARQLQELHTTVGDLYHELHRDCEEENTAE